MIILNLHLTLESYLERTFHFFLPHPEKILKNDCKFATKLTLVRASGLYEDKLCVALKHLNTLRNNIVHNLEHEISIKELDNIGRPFGKTWVEMVKSNNDKSKDTRIMMLAFLLHSQFKGALDALENNSQNHEVISALIYNAKYPKNPLPDFT